MSILIIVFFSAVGLFLFLFTFWRRLKEDYIGNQIFTSAFFSLIGLVLGYVLSRIFLHEWRFWLGFILSALGLFLGISVSGMKFFEVMEAWVFSILDLFIIINIYYLVTFRDIQTLSSTLFIFALIILFLYFDSHYKKFIWYKSGKSGFTGMFILGIYFLVRSIVALASPNMVFFFVSYDTFISGIIAFASFLTIINLSRI